MKEAQQRFKEATDGMGNSCCGSGAHERELGWTGLELKDPPSRGRTASPCCVLKVLVCGSPKGRVRTEKPKRVSPTRRDWWRWLGPMLAISPGRLRGGAKELILCLFLRWQENYEIVLQ